MNHKNGSGNFNVQPDVAAGASPTSLAMGDFDSDGNADVAVVNSAGNDISLLRGTGSGAFFPGVKCATVPQPRSVAAGDFNADGKIDLAVASSGNAVYILLGTGSGTFTEAGNYSSAGTPEFVVVADFNDDGRSDLAVTNSSTNSISVRLGMGNGAFMGRVDYACGTQPLALAVGDLNGDGRPDLATANYGGDNISVLLNRTIHRSAKFTTATNHPVGPSAGSVAVADFSGDYKADLAVTDESSNNVSIMLGIDGGGFASPVNFWAGAAPRHVTTGDFNRDGKTDLAVVNFGGHTVAVLSGTGTGSFTGEYTDVYITGAGGGPSSTVAGDFDGDGFCDLAVANFNTGKVALVTGQWGADTQPILMAILPGPNLLLWLAVILTATAKPTWQLPTFPAAACLFCSALVELVMVPLSPQP